MSFFNIKRGNDHDVRKQISKAMGTLSWPMHKVSIEVGDDVLVPAGYQYHVFNEFTDNGGQMTVEGELVIL